MDQPLYLDIETIPGQAVAVLEALRADAATEKAAVRAPSNYKDAAKIEEFVATRHAEIDSALDEKWRRTSLDGAFGQLAVAGFALGDAAPQTVFDIDWSSPGAEPALLARFNAELAAWVPANAELSTTVVGHYVTGFDLRFLVQRCMVHGIRPHPVLARAAQAKPWEADKVFDTMVQWAGARDTVKLDKLCRVFGLPTKGDIDGSKVWDYVREGRIEEVAVYCAADVERVRGVHRRMTFAPQLLAA
jgi:hypothetical protein